MNQGLFGVAKTNFQTQSSTFNQGEWNRCLVLSQSPGDWNIRIPDDCTEALVIAIGAGGEGGFGFGREVPTPATTAMASGGGGGALIAAIVPVTPGKNYNFKIGAGGKTARGVVSKAGSAGGATSFSNMLSAGGGAGGEAFATYAGGPPGGMGGIPSITTANLVLSSFKGGTSAGILPKGGSGRAAGASGGGASGSIFGDGLIDNTPIGHFNYATGGASWFAVAGKPAQAAGNTLRVTGGAGTSSSSSAGPGASFAGGGTTIVSPWVDEIKITQHNFLEILFSAGSIINVSNIIEVTPYESVPDAKGRNGGAALEATYTEIAKFPTGSFTIHAGNGGLFAGGGGLVNLTSKDIGGVDIPLGAVFRLEGGGGGFGGGGGGAAGINEGYQSFRCSMAGGTGGAGGGGGGTAAYGLVSGDGGQGGPGFIAIYVKGPGRSGYTSNILNGAIIAPDASDSLNTASYYYTSF